MSKYEVPIRTMNLIRMAKWYCWPSTELKLTVSPLTFENLPFIRDSTVDEVRECLEKHIGPFGRCWDWRYGTTFKPNGPLTDFITIRVFGRKAKANLTFMMLVLTSKKLDIDIKM